MQRMHAYKDTNDILFDKTSNLESVSEVRMETDVLSEEQDNRKPMPNVLQALKMCGLPGWDLMTSEFCLKKSIKVL